jgi:hypothetical protein
MRPEPWVVMIEPLVDVQFRLEAPALGFSAQIQIRSFGDRWMAVAEIAGEPQIGIGRNAREALEGALASLGQRVATACLLDPALLAPSAEIARQERSAVRHMSHRPARA